ncbi:MAG: hypothetical protein WC261_12050 [Synergistaceae bacterium]|jgi:hypothetical protein
MEIRITKVKEKDGRVTIHFQKPTPGGSEVDWDDYTINCGGKPRPEFYEAMNALVTHVRDICELPRESESLISILGVTCAYPQDIMGATITAKLRLRKSSVPLILNTPYMASELYSETSANDLLSGDCVDSIMTLHEECEKYINGEREQLSLDLASNG